MAKEFLVEGGKVPYDIDPVEKITIKKKVYDELIEDQKLLIALQNAGVDNWEGWDDVIQGINGD